MRSYDHLTYRDLPRVLDRKLTLKVLAPFYSARHRFAIPGWHDNRFGTLEARFLVDGLDRDIIRLSLLAHRKNLDNFARSYFKLRDQSNSAYRAYQPEQNF